MKKCIYRDYKNEETVVGFVEEAMWKSTVFCGGPKEDGEFITSDGEGHIETFYCTGCTDGAKELFDEILDHGYDGGVFFYDGETNTKPTDSDLVKLYSEYHVWYKVYDVWTDCGNEQGLTIYRGAAIPKYFLDTKLKGPMDSKIEGYDSIQTDLHGRPL